MAFIPAVNTAQVKVVQQLHGQTVLNVMYATNEGGWSGSELAALCDLYIAWWNDHFADNVHSDLHLVSVAARDMSVEDGAGVEVQAPALSGGNLNTQGALPGNAALAVRFKSGLTGRNRNGRIYVAGLAEERCNGNDVTDASRDGFLIAFGQLRDALLAAGYTPVVASFYDGTELQLMPNGETRKRPIPRPTALLTPIEQYLADTQIDSQKRRLSGRGV